MAAKNESDWESAVECFEELAARNVIKNELVNTVIASGRQKPTVMQYRSFLASKTGIDLVIQTFDESEQRFATALIVLNAVETNTAGLQAIVVTHDGHSAVKLLNDIVSFESASQICCRCYGVESSFKSDIESSRLGLQVVIGSVGRVYDLISIGAITLTSLKMFVAFGIDHEALNDFLVLLPSQIQRIVFANDLSNVPSTLKPIKIVSKDSKVYEDSSPDKNSIIESEVQLQSNGIATDVLSECLSTYSLSSISSPDATLICDPSIVQLIPQPSLNSSELCEASLNVNEDVRSGGESPAVKDILEELLKIMHSSGAVEKMEEQSKEAISSINHHETIVNVFSGDENQATKQSSKSNTDSPIVTPKSNTDSRSPGKKRKPKKKPSSLENIDINSIKMYFLKVDNDDLKVQSLRLVFKTLDLANAVVYCNHSTCRHLYEVMQKGGVNVHMLHEQMMYNDLRRVCDSYKKYEKCVLLASDRYTNKIDWKPETLTINYDVPNSRESFVSRLRHKNKEVDVLLTLVTPDEFESFKHLQQQLNFTAKEIRLDSNQKQSEAK